MANLGIHDKNQRQLGISGRIAAAFQASQMTPLLALVAFLLGLFAVLVTPREEEPQIDVTMANVFVPFPGASVQEVESLVATPAEQVFSRMSGVEHVYSVSRPSMAVLTVQFEVGIKYNEAVLRLHDVVQSHKDWLPPYLHVGEPVVKPKGIDDVPIVALSFWSKDENRSAYDMQQIARAAEIEFKRIPGTRDVQTLGGPDHVLRVSINPERLNAYGLTPQEVANVLQVANTQKNTGKLLAAQQEVYLETGSLLESAADVGQLVVSVRQGQPIFLRDVATISDGADQAQRYVWFGTGKGFNQGSKQNTEQAGSAVQGEFPAVTLQISKKPGVNAADVAEAVLARVASLKGTVIPDDVEVTVTRNYGQTATEKAQKLIGKLIFATAFVVLLVFFALGKREALIVGLAVTLTLAATLFASWAWGFTLNRVSLFALIFSIGILVDDAIVVVENIHRWQGLYPDKPLLEIIPPAVDEVGGPTILATLTVIAALLPMAFVSGLMGPYMSPIPINSSMGMAISLAIAFVVTPWLCAKWLHLDQISLKPQQGHPTSQSKLDATLDQTFRHLLTPFLDPERGQAMRRQLGIWVVVAILGSVSLAYVQWVVLKMLPFDNKSEFQVVLDMPVGTPVEDTARVLHELGAVLAEVEEVTHYQAYAGAASPINFNGLVRQYYLRSNPEMGDLQVNLVDKKQRHRSSHAIASSVRAKLAEVAAKYGGNAKVVEVPPGPPVLSPIVAEVYGADEAGRIQTAKQVRQVLSQTADIVGVDDSVEAIAPRQQLHVLQSKAALAGVDTQSIVDVVNMALAGQDITPLRNTGARHAIPIRLALPPEKQVNLHSVLQLKVKNRDGNLLPLSELVEVRDNQREQARYHKDLLPVVYVVGDMAGSLDSPLYGMFAARSALHALDLHAGGKIAEWFIHQPADPYASYAVKWDGGWQITYETFRDMGAAYAVGLILIYLLVVAHFKSYLVPLIIMAPIPLTIIGVMPGHALFGSQFTATSMIGMIALAGIIVRNSILLVDFIKEQVATGMAAREAVVQAAAVRAKPIALTALAAMLGALFILDDPIFNGLAISLIFGILVSTLLTLVVIPVLYYSAILQRDDRR